MTKQKMRKAFGCVLLFLAYDFLWVGFAAALLLSEGDNQGFIRYRDGVCSSRERGVRR